MQLSIYSVIESFPQMVSRFPFALVTLIDSYQIKKEGVQFYRKEYDKEIFNFQFDGLLMKGSTLVELHNEKKLFTGFDEIWFFQEKPDIYPSKIRLVGPIDIRTDYSKIYEQWMIESKAILGIGDGIGMGLNYITSSKEIQDMIEGNTM
jgi:hypothetical protein